MVAREGYRVESGPREVIGYHGCARETAERLLEGTSWLESQNRYDWLGGGIYFWEYAPYRALEWAEERYGEEAEVIRARIRLGNCINLLDRRHFAALRRVYDEAVALWAVLGTPVPINTSLGAHFLDRHLIDEYCRSIHFTEPEAPTQTVRGCFPEGDPIYPGSRILTKTHIQIAVRDADCLRSISLVRFEQRARRGK